MHPNTGSKCRVELLCASTGISFGKCCFFATADRDQGSGIRDQGSGIRDQGSEEVTARQGGRGNVGARGFTSFHGAKRRMNV
ncbi:MAG: hypothetical protein LBI62_01765 [Candidatus Accumulibacter sp.]|nr:hypothetical protein [Accumulibacter sp.]